MPAAGKPTGVTGSVHPEPSPQEDGVLAEPSSHELNQVPGPLKYAPARSCWQLVAGCGVHPHRGFGAAFDVVPAV